MSIDGPTPIGTRTYAGTVRAVGTGVSRLVGTVPTDGPTPIGARAYAGTVRAVG